MKKLTLALAGALLMAASAPSAFAQSYQGYDRGEHRGWEHGRGHGRMEELRGDIRRMESRLEAIRSERHALRDQARRAGAAGDRARRESIERELYRSEREQSRVESRLSAARAELAQMRR